MADFKGIIPAPALTPSEFGLFSATEPVLHTDSGEDTHWIRGFQVDYESTPSFVRNWDSLGSVSDVAVSKNGPANPPRFIEADPWFIEVEDNFGVLGALGLERYERVKRQLEGVTQKMVEREFSDGRVIRGKVQPTPYLAKSSTLTVLNGGAALGAPSAVALLEGKIAAASSVGTQGLLHLTRGVAAVLGSQYMLVRVEKSDSTVHLETNNGTTTVIGSGYTGNGPAWSIATSAALSSSTAWTFTTSTPHFIVENDTVEVRGLTGIHAPLNGTYTANASTTGSTIGITLAAAATIAAGAAGAATLAGATAQWQATDFVKWIYATGTTGVHLGPVDVVNENPAQGWDTAGTNDVRIKATRAAVAFFDPSIHLAVKVNLATAF